MKLFPSSSLKTLSNIATVVVFASGVITLLNGKNLIDALINGFIWWLIFWMILSLAGNKKEESHQKQESNSDMVIEEVPVASNSKNESNKESVAGNALTLTKEEEKIIRDVGKSNDRLKLNQLTYLDKNCNSPEEFISIYNAYLEDWTQTKDSITKTDESGKFKMYPDLSPFFRIHLLIRHNSEFENMVEVSEHIFLTKFKEPIKNYTNKNNPPEY